MLIEMINKKFGRLTVIAECATRNRGQAQWVCQCDCGNKTTVRGYSLRAGKSKSCGCLRVELGREMGLKTNLRHGEGRNGKETPEYRTWAAMLSRCNNPNHCNYKYYGARGITVCEHWSRYENFLADMGRRPSSKYSLDRVDNFVGYKPSNCRWITIVEQNNNKRSNRNITVAGVTKTLAEWLRETGGSRTTFRSYVRHEFSEEAAIRMIIANPTSPYTKTAPLITAFGVEATLDEWLADAGVSKRVFKRRTARGMSVEDALRLPVRRGRPLKKRSM